MLARLLGFLGGVRAAKKGRGAAVCALMVAVSGATVACLGEAHAPVANFTASPTGGVAPVTVGFTDLSSGTVTSWAWGFRNDGVVNSTEQNPAYTYRSEGPYSVSVSLTVTGPGGSDIMTKSAYIHVGAPVPSPAPSPTPTATPAPGAARMPPPGPFSYVGPMATVRWNHTATLLADGTVLVAGGLNSARGPIASAELYSPSIGTLISTGSLGTPRFGHAATLLRDGRVLVTGYGDDSLDLLSSAELYDPSTGAFSFSGRLATPRSSHTATLLPDGRVLIAGGRAGDAPTDSAELYDPSTGNFSSTGSMATPRYSQTATLLPDGRVLVTGGRGGLFPFLVQVSTEVYNPSTGTFSSTGSMATPRYSHTATLLPGGRVLITGGKVDVFFSRVEASAELYDPSTGAFSPTGSMATPRLEHRATLLADGRILVTGGMTITPCCLKLASAELYAPSSGTFTPAGSMGLPRASHTATPLAGGQVLIAGGIEASSAELWTGRTSPGS